MLLLRKQENFFPVTHGASESGSEYGELPVEEVKIC